MQCRENKIVTPFSLYRLPSSIGDVPFVITWGPINIADGIIVLLISLMAIAIAILHLRSMAVPFAILSFFCYVVQLALIATTQAWPFFCASLTISDTY